MKYHKSGMMCMMLIEFNNNGKGVVEYPPSTRLLVESIS